MPEPRVLILFNQPVLPVGHPDYESEADVLYSVKVVRDSLKAMDIPADEFGVTDDLGRLIARLTTPDFDVVFNLYEGTSDRSITEVYLTGLLEWLTLPYTGCPSFTLALARNKPLAKKLFNASRLRTPEFVIVASADFDSSSVAFPAIVKPATEDASIGIDQGSVVTTPAELAARVQFVLDHYGPPVLVERFIVGREIQISLIDLNSDDHPLILPLAEIAFETSPDRHLWPVYTYTAKWDEKSDEFKYAPVKVGVDVPPAVLAALHDAAIRTYRLLGCRDYARVDFRITPDGDVYLLELNPNPSITSMMIDSGLPAVEFTYDQFIASIVRNAVARDTRPKGARRVRQ